MSEREILLASVANTIKTYREGDLSEPTLEHVDRWLHQFTPELQLPFLREFNHVIKQLFITKEEFNDFFQSVVKSKALTNADLKEYWSSANFMNIQQNGQSQNEILSLFSRCLENEYNLDLDNCGEQGGDFIYLDDVMFSGNRIRNDLTHWINGDAPDVARVHVIVIGSHTSGRFYVEQQLNDLIARSGKNILISFWSAFSVENRRYYKSSSEVLWPTYLPNIAEVQTYIDSESGYAFEPREPKHVATPPFSSEAGRQVLESEFLIAGAKIRAMCENPKQIMRPLGFSPFGVGFGSMTVTYRNCPNNCPLAMWWGNPEATSGALHWYPLLPREGYSSPRNIFNAFTDF